MSTKIPSVTDTYFQHKVLTQVHGQPTYETLQTLSTEIKANAASVPSTLGGGHLGHLGLILSDARYATLPNTIPWISPVNPGPFDPPAQGTAPQIEAAKDVWRESKLQFDLYQATEKALIAQIVAAIDPIYLRALLNRATGQYSHDIRSVLLHLFSTYGKITPQQVKAKELAVYNMHYDISLPVDTVFNAIDDLADLAEHALSPMTPQQLIDLAYVILARQPILQQDLRLWNRRPAHERTWLNMLDHFRTAQSDLNSLPTAGDHFTQIPGHQANAVATMADLVAQRLLETITPEDLVATPSVPTDAVNAALQQRETSLAAREAALLTQMTELMTLMRSTNNSNRGGGRGNGGRNNNRGGGGRGRAGGGRAGGGTSTNPKFYCWTHGWCAHPSDQCQNQAEGHQTTATSTNMMGGSTAKCYWLNNT
jgi:uncharacterized membrane protein YgcG